MNRTPEQVAAEVNLETAIGDALAAWGLPCEFVGDWLLVVECPDPNETEGTAYAQLNGPGHLPSHRIAGLLDIARSLVTDDEDMTGGGV